MKSSNIAIGWDEFSALRPKQRAECFKRDGDRFQFLIHTQQVNKDLLMHLIELADFIYESNADLAAKRYLRQILAPFSCILYFTQVSTRTFSSFSTAAQSLGMITEEIRDPNLSSMYKGESELDTLLTLASLADLIVTRQNDSTFLDRLTYELLSRGMNTRIINGGSASDQHPTQGLLEIYTLLANLDITRKPDQQFEVSLIGDLLRSRTARSLSYILALFPNVKQVFIAPSELQMGEDMQGFLKENSIEFTMSDDINHYIERSDAFYMMRIQDEYSETSEQVRQKYTQYYLSLSKVEKMKPHACIIHPLPRRLEIPIEIDFNPRAKYWEAVERGRLIRMALILYMFGFDDIAKLRSKAYPV